MFFSPTVRTCLHIKFNPFLVQQNHFDDNWSTGRDLAAEKGGQLVVGKWEKNFAWIAWLWVCLTQDKSKSIWYNCKPFSENLRKYSGHNFRESYQSFGVIFFLLIFNQNICVFYEYFLRQQPHAVTFFSWRANFSDFFFRYLCWYLYRPCMPSALLFLKKKWVFFNRTVSLTCSHFKARTRNWFFLPNIATKYQCLCSTC